MQTLLAKGYKAKRRPSGHDISEKFGIDNGAAIPPNLIAIPNTESNSFYLRYCEGKGFKPHPARYPAELPEYFIRMLTEPGDFVVDPFAGSCVYRRSLRAHRAPLGLHRTFARLLRVCPRSVRARSKGDCQTRHQSRQSVQLLPFGPTRHLVEWRPQGGSCRGRREVPTSQEA